MQIAIMSDIHSNRQALSACLEHARKQGARHYAFLGDYVGYGADPEWVIETIQKYIEQGAIAIAGNHDRAISTSISMSSNARLAVDWTRNRLNPAMKTFLQELSLTITEENRLFVHSDASAPELWNYVTDAETASISLIATKAQVTFCGHVHIPAIYAFSRAGKITSFTPVTNVPVPLLLQRQWLCVIGSVGQPRDRNPAASYAMLDTDKMELTYLRVPYDVEGAANRIRAVGLPDILADRLAYGR